jgi:hypothetical protein
VHPAVCSSASCCCCCCSFLLHTGSVSRRWNAGEKSQILNLIVGLLVHAVLCFSIHAFSPCELELYVSRRALLKAQLYTLLACVIHPLGWWCTVLVACTAVFSKVHLDMVWFQWLEDHSGQIWKFVQFISGSDSGNPGNQNSLCSICSHISGGGLLSWVQLPVRVTKDIVETYQLCNPSFQHSESLNPKRYLTNPSVPEFNNGCDNENHDLILYYGCVLVNENSTRR